jgi:hypothetical protein
VEQLEKAVAKKDKPAKEEVVFEAKQAKREKKKKSKE